MEGLPSEDVAAGAGEDSGVAALHMIQSQSLPAIARNSSSNDTAGGAGVTEATLGSQDGTINFNDFLTVVGPANLSRQRQSTMKALFMKHSGASSEKQALLTFDQFHAMMTEMSPVELVMNNLWVAARSARHASPSVDISRARKQVQLQGLEASGKKKGGSDDHVLIKTLRAKIALLEKNAVMVKTSQQLNNELTGVRRQNESLKKQISGLSGTWIQQMEEIHADAKAQAAAKEKEIWQLRDKLKAQAACIEELERECEQLREQLGELDQARENHVRNMDTIARLKQQVQQLKLNTLKGTTPAATTASKSKTGSAVESSPPASRDMAAREKARAIAEAKAKAKVKAAEAEALARQTARDRDRLVKKIDSGYVLAEEELMLLKDMTPKRPAAPTAANKHEISPSVKRASDEPKAPKEEVVREGRTPAEATPASVVAPAAERPAAAGASKREKPTKSKAAVLQPTAPASVVTEAEPQAPASMAEPELVPVDPPAAAPAPASAVITGDAAPRRPDVDEHILPEGEAVAEESGKASGGVSVEIPPVPAPAAAPAEAPVTYYADAPAQAPAELPIPAPDEAPMSAPAEAPAPALAEAPVSAPVAVPGANPEEASSEAPAPAAPEAGPADSLNALGSDEVQHEAPAVIDSPPVDVPSADATSDEAPIAPDEHPSMGQGQVSIEDLHELSTDMVTRAMARASAQLAP